jgi:amino acid permease
VTKLIPHFFDEFDIVKDADWSDMYKLYQIIGVNLFALPICLIKKFTGLRYFSLLGVFGVFYATIVIF